MNDMNDMILQYYFQILSSKLQQKSCQIWQDRRWSQGGGRGFQTPNVRRYLEPPSIRSKKSSEHPCCEICELLEGFLQGCGFVHAAFRPPKKPIYFQTYHFYPQKTNISRYSMQGGLFLAVTSGVMGPLQVGIWSYNPSYPIYKAIN